MKTIILSTAMLISTLAMAKNSAFMKVTGSKQGIFKGESLSKGKENTSEIISYSFEEVSPKDPASGQTSGKRQIRPVTIVKSWGAASNQFYSALSQNEVLKEVKIDFYSADPRGTGMEVLDHSVLLNDATLSDVKDSTTMVNGDLQDTETISFSFRKITITDKSGSVFTDELTPN